ncbi:hemagglutinin repeat-containing protein [Endozoicomonas sp. ALB115]|uniref:hemagglutinin repeat-containing protein n=1 Tax=Endozoicomonas sp. ALB115 TaxID=3403074 RepID=UPI003BB65385
MSVHVRQNTHEAGHNENSTVEKQSFKQSGLTVSVTSSIITALQTADLMKELGSKTDNDRLKALAGATAALSAKQAYDGATAVAQAETPKDMADAAGVGISASLGTSKQASTTTRTSNNAHKSTLVAGGDITLNASGAGNDSDISITGSDINAGNNANLNAEDDINLLAAKNTAELDSESNGSSASIGASFKFGGSQNGLSFNASVSGNRGNAEGVDTTWQNTQINAGNQVDLSSGQDTNLKGAVVKGEKVVADVGGDLNIESLQDTSTYESEQKSGGVGVSICVPPLCAGASSVSANIGKTDIDSDYRSVTEQSGIKAGDEGFDITVGDNTDLKGALIASSDEAIAGDKNSLTTGTLTNSDIENRAEYDATSANLGFSTDGVSAPSALSASDDDSSTTQSGISGGAVTITNEEKQRQLTDKDADTTVAELNRDVNSSTDSNALDRIFDEQEIQTGFEITRAFVSEVNTFVEQQAKAADTNQKALDEERAKPVDQQDPALIRQIENNLNELDTWQMGGTGRTVLTALSVAASGNVTGSASQMVQSAAVSYLQSLATQEVKHLADYLDDKNARAALQGLVGCAGAAAQGASCGSSATGAAASVVINNLLKEKGEQLTSQQREKRKNLVINLIAGVTAAAGGETEVAAAAGQIEAENNALCGGACIGLGIAVIKVADMAFTAYEIWDDAKAVRDGEKTVEELAAEKGTDYVAQALAGRLGKYGLKVVKKGGKWFSGTDDQLTRITADRDSGNLTNLNKTSVVKDDGAKLNGGLASSDNGILGNEVPYDSTNVRKELSDGYGAEKVTSTTAPPLNAKNVKFAGQRHPVTGVVFDRRGFPIFDDVAAFDTRIPIEAFRTASYDDQMKMASKGLADAIQRGEVNASKFSADQLRQINRGSKTIDGFSWHHHQDTGRMQLVPRDIHKRTGHIGWEGMSNGK